MKLLLRDYLSLLREREELDALLPDLLTQMGYTIVKVPRRGESEHGRDIVAVRDSATAKELWIFVIQQGDLTEAAWQGPGKMRADAEAALDVAYEDTSLGVTKAMPRHLVLVHNGTANQTITQRVHGFCRETKEKRGIEVERWDLHRLVDLFHDHLLGDRLLHDAIAQRQLRQTVVFLDTDDYDLHHFKNLLQIILPTGMQSERAIERVFASIRLALRLVLTYAQAAEDLRPALIAYEYTLLRLWHWMLTEGHLADRWKEALVKVLMDCFKLGLSYISKIQPRLESHHGLALGGAAELIEYPMRTFTVLGHLSYLLLICSAFEQREMAQGLRRVLVEVALNNPASGKPLLDSHSIEIGLVTIALLSCGDCESAKNWVRMQLDKLAFRKRIGRRFPELHNRLDAVIEYEATGEAPFFYDDASSYLIYMLLELTLLTEDRETYDTFAPIFRGTGIDLQLWYPPDNVEEKLFLEEVTSGTTESSIRLPESYEAFLEETKERHQRFDTLSLRTQQEGLGILLYLACKHFRTPLLPYMWRRLAPGLRATAEEDQGMMSAASSRQQNTTTDKKTGAN